MPWTKDKLVAEFKREPKKYYEVELFRREGFARAECPKCGKGYWSLGRKDCGDSSHTPYSFFQKNPKPIKYTDFWKRFADFFAKRGHAVTPRYPVVARWRDDLYFNIASIVDFQRLEDGKIVFEYPANPLVVPQMCLRFGDVANIGVTGRHLSCFMMAGQHAFNHPKEGYWMDECIEHNYAYLREVLQIPKEEIVYGEDVWSMPDFSSFGPSIESFSKGIELVNSVFTAFRLADDKISDLDMKVIDVGWGFERLLWYASGTSTVYDAVFPREIEWMKAKSGLRVPGELFDSYSRLSATLDVETVRDLREEKERIAKLLGISLAEMEKTIAPLQAIYAIADHARCLLLAISDGALPSNMAGGYNLRVLARRAFSFITEYDLNFDLLDVMAKEAEELKGLFPELAENLDNAQLVLDSEKRKYAESLEKAKRAAREVIAKPQELTPERLNTLYESQGVTPEILERVAREQGKPVSIPTSYYRQVAEKHLMAKVTRKPTKFQGLPATRPLYYEDVNLAEAAGTILAKEDNAVVFDQTVFYPEGGGQATDRGTVDRVEMLAAEKAAGGIIVHHLKDASKFKVGQKVRQKIDAERRWGLRRHHSATHLLTGVCRQILGPLAWQAGAKKEEDIAHLDITHYERVTPEQRKAMEVLANQIVQEGRPITVQELERGEAEQTYGFRIYTGGGAIGKRFRVINIQDWDVQSCGGTHCASTREIGPIKITSVEQVQDGLIRLYYRVGPSALKYEQESSELLEKAAKILAVTREQVPRAVDRFFSEWKERGKQVDKLQELLAENLAFRLLAEAKSKGEKRIDTTTPLDPKLSQKLALSLAREPGLTAIVRGTDGFIAVACHPKSADSAADVLRSLGAKGGGARDFAQGKIP
jgi:alanyl-tRNA synthetase